MQVEELLRRLQDMPPHYVVCCNVTDSNDHYSTRRGSQTALGSAPECLNAIEFGRNSECVLTFGDLTADLRDEIAEHESDYNDAMDAADRADSAQMDAEAERDEARDHNKYLEGELNERERELEEARDRIKGDC